MIRLLIPLLVYVAGMATGCESEGLVSLDGEVETLIAPADLPSSENAVYTDSGRFFVVGENILYEITGGPQGFEAVPLIQEECLLGGLVDRGEVLYAACFHLNLESPSETYTELLRIDPTGAEPAIERAVFPVGSDSVYLNGMEFGPDGALYVSNSFALWLGDAAVFRVEIVSEHPLAIEVTDFVVTSASGDFAQGGGEFPNGLRFHGDTMYVSRGFQLAKTELFPGGGHAALEPVYTTGGLAVVDDFDIAGGHLFIAQSRALSIVDPKLFDSSLVIADMNGRVRSVVALPFIPSSTAVRSDTLFGDDTIILTSVINGGLYRIRVSEQAHELGLRDGR